MEKINCRLNSLCGCVCMLIKSAEKLFMDFRENALAAFL